jgi:hypothetical protein
MIHGLATRCSRHMIIKLQSRANYTLQPVATRVPRCNNKYDIGCNDPLSDIVCNDTL